MIEISPEVAYLWLSIGTFVAWSVAYIYGTHYTKKKQLIRGLVAIPFAIALENLVFFQDYWFPQSIFSLRVGSWHILIEDIIFGFSMGGLVPVLSDFLRRGCQSLALDFERNTRETVTIHIITYTVAIVLVLLTQINSMILIPVVLIGMSGIFLSTLTVYYFSLCVVSGMFSTLILFGIYSVGLMAISNTEDILKSWWYLHKSSLDMRMYGVPLTELFWAFSYGMYSASVNRVAVSEKRM